MSPETRIGYRDSPRGNADIRAEVTTDLSEEGCPLLGTLERPRLATLEEVTCPP